MFELLTAKPVLIAFHLGFAILAIDAFLWLLGEIVANAGSARRRMWAAGLGVVGFFGSWIVGGYYYVTYYGSLVKPIIQSGSAPWAHIIAMEAKEHVFLFLIPIAITLLLLAKLSPERLKSLGIKSSTARLAGAIAGVGIFLGALGFIVSAAARWGII